MNKVQQRLVFFARGLIPILFCLVCAFPHKALSQEKGSDKKPLALVQNLIDAFNAHDVDTMMTMVSNDIQWLSIGADSVVKETDGKHALRKAMRDYFKAIPSARSEIEGALPSGSFVAVRERAFWSTEQGERSQTSLAVYEIGEGKILRVWYFPAE